MRFLCFHFGSVHMHACEQMKLGYAQFSNLVHRKQVELHCSFSQTLLFLECLNKLMQLAQMHHIVSFVYHSSTSLESFTYTNNNLHYKHYKTKQRSVPFVVVAFYMCIIPMLQTYIIMLPHKAHLLKASHIKLTLPTSTGTTRTMQAGSVGEGSCKCHFR